MVGQLSDLRRPGDAVRHEGPRDYGPAVLLVVKSVRVHRRSGRRPGSRFAAAECGPPRVMHGRPCNHHRLPYRIERRSSATSTSNNLMARAEFASGFVLPAHRELRILMIPSRVHESQVLQWSATTADHRLFPPCGIETARAFATFADTNPLPASSGRTMRHRLI
jgi:hypothetical protein